MNKIDIQLPQKRARQFLPEKIDLDVWDVVQPYFEDLQHRPIHSKSDLEQWLQDRSELESAISEEVGWRYIRMTCDTTDENAKNKYQHFVKNIEPQISPYAQELDKKLVANPFVDDLDQENCFTYLRRVKKKIDIYREENIPLFTQMQVKEQEYGAITGKMTINLEGQELTMQQASIHLQDQDRQLRETVYRKMQERRMEDVDALDNLFDELVKIRHQVAQNAGFDNYRDFKFAAMGRFDYTPEDCFLFHDAIAKEILPVINEIQQERKQALGVDPLRPWDTEVDITGKPPLRPFTDGKDLTNKAADCFFRLRPFFGERLHIMEQMGHLDLESRKGKAPGGYNYPLMETGVPFIFMNAASSITDVKVIVHEGGHAIHSFLTRNLWIRPYKQLPAEVAELASMSMELISMDHWDVFFEKEEDLNRAKKEQLRSVLSIFPWVAAVDRFQHWLYTHPEHTAQERKQEWVNTISQYSTQTIDWSGLEQYRAYAWQKQLHLFEVPFYYIEYAMAQLGAIAMWKQYKTQPKKALDNYMEALSLGYTRPIGEIYEAAGIKFDFSQDYVRELAQFVKEELDAIQE